MSHSARPRSLSVARRLALGFGALVGLSLLGSVAGGWQAHLIGAEMARIVEVNNAMSHAVGELRIDMDEMSIQARSIALMTEMKSIAAEIDHYKLAKANYGRDQQMLQGLVSGPGANEDERRIAGEAAALAAAALPMLDDAVKQGADGNNVEAALDLTNRVLPKELAWRASLASLQKAVGVDNGASMARARGEQVMMLVVLAVSAAAAAAIGAFVGWRTIRSVQSPIDSAVRFASRVAEGDLSTEVKIEREDELGLLLHAMDGMQRKLRGLVGHIRESAESIGTASKEVADGNQDLSVRTEQTAGNLQHAASAMTQLTGNVRQSADAAVQANSLAVSASEVARRGGQAVSNVVATMDEINASSKKISDIIGVIDGIAFQTNILALNAAVEAARAGEQGRGFAVVAGEVRSLAQRSAEAAKEIKSLIGASVERVETGARQVADAGATMREIESSVERVTAIIGEISAASAEQSAGIGQVGGAVSQLETMTQQNAALVEQSAAAAESLRSQASSLNTLVGTFRLA
ncbi:MAG TPA: methyl-accepting chemotaxis protein [Burkholderiaceae bacterium]